ncbi:VOC family protein [Streptomyces sp. NPDC050400]|uniref:VOC family protein n=1 Tax=Streptomyces sp. NPDC050400 TaxID=3365610 RepID=UPI0037AC1D66
MHRSRLFAVLIDTPKEQASDAVEFWRQALGVEVEPEVGNEQFTILHGAIDGAVAAVQALDGDGDSPRVHLDVETDDVDAETARLVGLGAVQVGEWGGCRVLRVPGGHIACVVPVHSEAEVFAARARTWGA